MGISRSLEGSVAPSALGNERSISSNKRLSGRSGLSWLRVPGDAIGMNLPSTRLTIVLPGLKNVRLVSSAEALRPPKFRDRKVGYTLRDWLTTAPRI